MNDSTKITEAFLTNSDLEVTKRCPDCEQVMTTVWQGIIPKLICQKCALRFFHVLEEGG